jgi:class 3 adenylate cyclase
MLMIAFMLGIFSANGAVQWNAARLMDGEVLVYEDAGRSAKEIQLLSQKQDSVLKDIALDAERSDRYREYFYTLSMQSDKIQDRLHNLKILFADDPQLAGALTETISLHKELMMQTVSGIFDFDGKDAAFVRKSLEDMDKGYDAMTKSTDDLVSAIQAKSDSRIDSIRRKYRNLILGSLAAGLCICLFLAVMMRLLTKKTQKEILALSKTLNSYIPPQLVQSVMKNRKTIPVLSRRNITVCFTDLEGFTAASELCEPELIARFLNQYLTEMAIIAQSWGGMVDKFMGDGIMIIFGAFEGDADAHALHCIHMAAAMQMRMKELAVQWRNSGFEADLGLRIGINSGHATVGSVGPSDRLSFTAIGSAVNIASRLEKLCTTGKILIGHDTQLKVKSTFECTLCEERAIKGLSRSIKVYEINPELHPDSSIQDSKAPQSLRKG